MASFRPKPETELALAELMDRWRCNRSQAINRAILDVHASTSETDRLAESNATSRKLQNSILSPAEKVLRETNEPVMKVGATGFPKLSRTVQKPDWKK